MRKKKKLKKTKVPVKSRAFPEILRLLKVDASDYARYVSKLDLDPSTQHSILLLNYHRIKTAIHKENRGATGEGYRVATLARELGVSISTLIDYGFNCSR